MNIKYSISFRGYSAFCLSGNIECIQHVVYDLNKLIESTLEETIVDFSGGTLIPIKKVYSDTNDGTDNGWIYTGICDFNHKSAVRKLAEKIKKEFNQKNVDIEFVNVDMEEI